MKLNIEIHDEDRGDPGTFERPWMATVALADYPEVTGFGRTPQDAVEALLENAHHLLNSNNPLEKP